MPLRFTHPNSAHCISQQVDRDFALYVGYHRISLRYLASVRPGCRLTLSDRCLRDLMDQCPDNVIRGYTACFGFEIQDQTMT
jgi:hypothetical protein